MKIAIRHTVLALALGSAALAAACGGSQPAPEAAPAPSSAPSPAMPMPDAGGAAKAAAAAPASSAAEPAPVASAAPVAPTWKDLTTEDQKKEFMKSEVIPKMKEEFQGFDAKKFAEVRCTTCHGESAMKGKFDMPNPKLPKLDPKDMFAKHMKKTPEITKFMMEHVSPDMAKILGIDPYNPETKTGFGCFNCHTMAGK